MIGLLLPGVWFQDYKIPDENDDEITKLANYDNGK